MKIAVFRTTSAIESLLGCPWTTYDRRQPEGDRCRFFPTWAEAFEYADRIARLP